MYRGVASSSYVGDLRFGAEVLEKSCTIVSSLNVNAGTRIRMHTVLWGSRPGVVVRKGTYIECADRLLLGACPSLVCSYAGGSWGLVCFGNLRFATAEKTIPLEVHLYSQCLWPIKGYRLQSSVSRVTSSQNCRGQA